ncbi:hypothetical protein EDB85DRAFT_2142112 [Lactarius pseudohatsudake]|nr:hypothetical protein EDB85DRAFT_2142112 [Lactarius pseudohatsudake]
MSQGRGTRGKAGVASLSSAVRDDGPFVSSQSGILDLIRQPSLAGWRPRGAAPTRGVASGRAPIYGAGLEDCILFLLPGMTLDSCAAPRGELRSGAIGTAASFAGSKLTVPSLAALWWTDEALSILRTIRTTGYKPGPADEPPRPVPVSAPVVTGPRIQSLESTSASWHQVGQGSDALEDALPLPREMDPISCWLKQRKAGEAIANASGARCEDNGLGMERDVSVHEAGTANTARQDGVGKLSSTAKRLTKYVNPQALASTLRQSTSTTPSLRKTRTDATPPRCNPFTANLAVAPTRDSGPHHHQLAATPPQHGAQNGANAPRKGPTVWPSLAARMRRASPTADND